MPPLSQTANAGVNIVANPCARANDVAQTYIGPIIQKSDDNDLGYDAFREAPLAVEAKAHPHLTHQLLCSSAAAASITDSVYDSIISTYGGSEGVETVPREERNGRYPANGKTASAPAASTPLEHRPCPLAHDIHIDVVVLGVLVADARMVSEGAQMMHTARMPSRHIR
ncbi:uncharacterized protein SCHCODRAFT_02713401 [Schizophyllum commune H4-8]|nr:uncharacterized protein SCHCODRAFT_02713401 [Schizophyllum commune H4-8]KAI5887567.1 hypothetical protein SCHCODRAFT_02713401 [Schizophyllum commune H4-8]